MTGGKRAWTDDERRHVKALLKKGKSMGDVGRALGLSRNMAIGRISRDGELHAFLAKIVLNKVSVLTPIGHAPRYVDLPRPLPDPDDEPRGPGQRLVDLKADVCRWPVGLDDQGHHLFCGLARQDDCTAYCRRHHAMAHPAGGHHG